MGVSYLNSVFHLIKNLFETKTATEPVMQYYFEKPKIEQVELMQCFERCKPEEVGVSSLRIQRFFEEIADDASLNMHSVIILRKGKIISEATFGMQRLDIAKSTFSACKSIVSLLIGIMLDEKKIHLNDKVLEIFKDKANALSKVQLRDLTIMDLLTMKSGVVFNEAYSMVRTDWIRGFITSSVLGKSGENFNYNSLNTYMLAAIIDRKSGMPFREYLDKKLFEPLGISGTYWEKSPDGIEKGGWGLYIRPENAAKIGQLVLNDGVWNGKQIVSKKYLGLALTSHAQTPQKYGDYNYGFHIWCGRKNNSFLFNGMFGQNILAFCDSGILLVSNAGNDENFQQSNYFKYAAEYFGNNISDVTHDEKKNYKNLSKFISSLSDYNKFPDIKENVLFYKYKKRLLNNIFIPKGKNAASTGLLPVMLQAVENTYTKGLKRIYFKTEDRDLYMLYEENTIEYKINIGINSPAETDLKCEKLNFHIAAKGTPALDEDGNFVFKIRIDFLETPWTRFIKLRFSKKGILLEQDEHPGEDYVIHALAEFLNEIPGLGIVSKASPWFEKGYMEYRADAKFHPVLHMEADKK